MNTQVVDSATGHSARITQFWPAFFDSAPQIAVESDELAAPSTRWWAPFARCGILAALDLLALAMSAGLGYWLWPHQVLGQTLATYSREVPLICLLPVGYAAAGLYPGFGLGAIETLRKATFCTTIGYVSFAASVFLLKLPDSFSRVGYGLAWTTTLVLVPTIRFVALTRLTRLRWWKKPAVLFGSEQWVEKTTPALQASRSLGYGPVAAVLSGGRRPFSDPIANLPVLSELGARLLARRLECAVLVEESEAHSSTASWLWQNFPRVLLLREYGDLPLEGAQVRTLGNALGIEFSNNLLIRRNRLCKRALDVLVGLIALTSALPLIALGGLMVWLVDGRPLFFAQERDGVGGRRIKVWKLRTMYKDAELRLKRVLAAEADLRKEWEEHYKLKHDPRVLPRIGNPLRRWSIDELPQLWNVLVGEMSLVGPRPVPSYHLEKLPRDSLEVRSRVLPGLTGMWQVMVRGSGTLDQLASLDTYYVRNWSIWLDIYLLARTSFAVFSGNGAY
jgi:Undecaprenyl-phosphate galactose phosphotransferase WbaP